MQFQAPFRSGRVVVLLAVLAALAGCGGGGGSDTTAPAVVSPAAAQAQQCSPNNPYRADADAPTTLGTLADEKRWARAYLDAAYLWYREIAAVDATVPAYSDDTAAGFGDAIANYFDALLTPAVTASGKRKDQFSFTYPTRDWNALAQSGVALGYGIEWSMVATAPPRNIRIALVEPGSPADLAGLQRGDTLVAVDDTAADDATEVGADFLFDSLYSPQEGRVYTFAFSRQGNLLAPLALRGAALARRPVLLTQVIEVGDQKVGYVVFNDHNVPAEGQLIAAIEQLRVAGVSDLVLDLRYNGGGYLYIANALAFMIAGPARAGGRVFERLRYNDKRASSDSAFIDTACLPDANFRCTSAQRLPTLNLARVHVLVGGSTCSASESIINGLRGVDVEVRLIGNSTCGKPYGFTPRDNCGISYFPIEFEGVNAKGFGDYADGFAPQCAADDDLGRALGDPAEGRLAAALHLRATGSCPLPPATPLSAKPGPRAAEPVLLRPPVRENRVQVPLQR